MLKCQKEIFTLGEEYTYLNCAYMSPMLKSVEEEGIKGIQGKRMPVNVTPDDFFKPTEHVRSLFAKLINSPHSDRIVIIPSVSYGISSVTKNIALEAGQKVIVLGEQFPSNYYPWKRLCDQHGGELQVISRPNSATAGQDWNSAILDTIDQNTVAIAMSHVHWADGTRFDLKAIRKKTQEVGALLIIDGTQSVGALPFDVSEIQPDALICAGYKWLLGPYSIGLAYFGEAFLKGVPLEENWINRFESQDFAGLVNYNDHYQPGALRYEVGEHSNFVLLPMLKRALEQIDDWGIANIQQYCDSLFSEASPVLLDAGFTIENSDYRGAHLFGIRNANEDKMKNVKEALQKEKISVSVRGDAIRVSPHVYNDAQDIDKLVTTLIAAK